MRKESEHGVIRSGEGYIYIIGENTRVVTGERERERERRRRKRGDKVGSYSRKRECVVWREDEDEDEDG